MKEEVQIPGWSSEHEPHPPEDTPTRQLPDLTGEVYGLLTVKGLHGFRIMRDGQRHREWACECICGKPALRTTIQLRTARRNNTESMCRECWIELVRGGLLARTDRISEARLARFEQDGTLYSPFDEDAMIEDMREQLLREDIGYVMPDEAPLLSDPQPVLLEGYPFYGDVGRSASGQRAMAMFPIEAQPRHLFRCHICGVFFMLGLGCGFCLHQVCRYCVEKEQHICDFTKPVNVCDEKDMELLEQPGGYLDWISPGRVGIATREQFSTTEKRRGKRKSLLYVVLPGQDGVVPLTERQPGHYHTPTEQKPAPKLPKRKSSMTDEQQLVHKVQHNIQVSDELRDAALEHLRLLTRRRLRGQHNQPNAPDCFCLYEVNDECATCDLKEVCQHVDQQIAKISMAKRKDGS